jgi:N-acetyl-anhydromuramyl-L-alanine amidase AmpD
MTDATHPWPDKIATRIWLPDKDFSHQVRRPSGIVVHSGESADWVAEASLKNANEGKPESYHFAHSRQFDCLVQLVSLRSRAWHAGTEGNDAIGVALKGPWDLDPRGDDEREDFGRLMFELQNAFAPAQLKWWCTHAEITPGKRDPGAGFKADWIEGYGFKHDPRGPRFWVHGQ